MPGRVLLYLFDHPAGVTLWQLEEAVLDGMANGLLKAALYDLAAAGDVKPVPVWTTHLMIRGSDLHVWVGYQLTTASWLRMTRAIQDAEQTRT